MKRVSLFLAVCAVFALCTSPSFAGMVGTTETVRAAAAATTSNVFSQVDADYRARSVFVYADVTIGASGFPVVLTPYASADGTTVASSLYLRDDKATTISASGKYCIRLAAEDLGGNVFGVAVKAITSGAGTSVALQAREDK